MAADEGVFERGEARGEGCGGGAGEGCEDGGDVAFGFGGWRPGAGCGVDSVGRADEKGGERSADARFEGRAHVCGVVLFHMVYAYC